AAVLRADRRDAPYLACEQGRVLLAQPDRAAVAVATERARRPAAEDDDDAVAHAARVPLHLLGQADADTEQPGGRDRAPLDAQHGQLGAQLLRADVVQELADQDEGAHVRPRGHTCSYPFSYTCTCPRSAASASPAPARPRAGPRRP